MNKCLVRCGLPAFALSALAGAVQAAGFQLLEQNASGLGTAYAGSAATAEDASTVYFNPAGMSALKGRQVSLGLSAIRPSFKFTDQGSSAGTLTGTGGDAGGWAYLPNAYMTWALDPRWTVGLGLGAPFGLKTEYDNPWVGGAQSLSFDIKTYNVNPSVAFKVDDSLSVGFGLNWQRMEVEYKKLAGVISAPAPLSSTQVLLDASGSGWGWNAGVRWAVSSQTQLGLSYRSRIKQDLNGSLTVSGPAAGLSPALTSGDAKASLTLPDLLILSAAHKLDDRWQLVADVSRTGWSSMQQVDIVRTSGTQSGSTAQTLDASFRNTWRAAVGVHHRTTEAVTLKAGIAYDQSPVRDAQHRLVSLPDNDRTWLSVGGQWRLAPGHRLDAGLAYLVVGKSSVDSNQAPLGGRVVGEYSANVWITGLQYSFAF